MIVEEAKWSSPEIRYFIVQSTAEDVTLADLMKLAQENNIRPEDMRLCPDSHNYGDGGQDYYIEASWVTG